MNTTQTFGRFEVVPGPLLGMGSMSIVYRGYDRSLDRAVAIKTLRLDLLSSDQSDEILTRFRAEARLNAKLKHPNFIDVYELKEDWDPPYIAMELISAKDVEKHVREKFPFTRAQIGRIGLELLSALGYLHSLGYIHRDIKPANLLWAEGHPLKVTDFGVAHSKVSTLTVIGSVIGTLAYMAPEQIMGEIVDERIDLWATGIVLYELLTGTRCYTGDHDTVQRAVLTLDPFEGPNHRAGLLDSAFEPVIRRALEKDRNARFRNAEEFRRSWMAALNGSEREFITPHTQPRSGSDEPFSSRGRSTDGRSPDQDRTVIVAQTQVPQPTEALTAKAEQRIVLSKRTRWFAVAIVLCAILGIWLVKLLVTASPVPIARLAEDAKKIVGNAECSDLSVRENKNLLEVKGYVKNSQVEAQLRSQLAQLAKSDQLSVDLLQRDSPFCDIVDVLNAMNRKAPQPVEPLQVRVANDVARLSAGEQLDLEIVIPDFDAYVYIDYVQGKNTVIHLLAPESDPRAKVGGNTLLPFNAGKVTEPFGDDMIVVIASSAPQLDQAPAEEDIESYLARLRSKASSRHDGTILGAYTFIRTDAH